LIKTGQIKPDLGQMSIQNR